MVKRIVLMTVLALGFVAAASQTQAIDPIPECWPCPWVR